MADVLECGEDVLVAAIVNSRDELVERRVIHRDHFGAIDDILLEVGAREVGEGGDDRDEHKLLEIEELRGREGAQRVREELAATLKVADEDKVEAFVDLEAVAALPIGVFEHLRRVLHALRRDLIVAKGNAEADALEHKI